MLGVDVGGTFTDVVAVRDGADHGHQGRERRRRPGRAGRRGRAAPRASTGHAVFNHASTMGLNAVITRTLPKVAFLTTEGHRDMLDRGRIWRPPASQTDPSWRRSFGDVARPLVPRYLRRGDASSGCSPTAACYLPLDEDTGAHPARGARSAATSRASRSA